jgi:rhomboid protease GluP
MNVGTAVIAVSVGAYVAALLLDIQAAARPTGPFDILSPSGVALDRLGMTGAYAWARGRWWTVLTAIYLHASVLHLLFNMLWVNQLAPAVEELYGRSRLILIFTAAGVAGFVVSNLVGVTFTLGASGSVFGLFGAMIAYGRTRGGRFGMAVVRQYGPLAAVLFIMGFLMPGINNLAHAGGFVGGYLLGVVIGHGERSREYAIHHVAAALTIALTVLAFGLALWTGFVR